MKEAPEETLWWKPNKAAVKVGYISVFFFLRSEIREDEILKILQRRAI